MVGIRVTSLPKASVVIAGLLLAAAAVMWLAGCSGEQSLREPESPALQDAGTPALADAAAPPDPAASPGPAGSALTGGSVGNGIETATFALG